MQPDMSICQVGSGNPKNIESGGRIQEKGDLPGFLGCFERRKEDK